MAEEEGVGLPPFGYGVPKAECPSRESYLVSIPNVSPRLVCLREAPSLPQIYKHLIRLI